MTDWGEGYFLGVEFDDFEDGLTYEDVQVGLLPTAGSGYVTLDPDKMGVFKITDKNSQKLVVIQNGDKRYVQMFDLSGLTLS